MGLKNMLVKAFNLQGNSNPSGVSDYADVPKSYPWDWWQRDMKLEDVTTNTTVEACVATISQTIAMLPVKHVRTLENGGTELVTTSAASRVMRKPNQFQTKSAFWVDFVRAMLLNGEGFGVVTRNGRYEVDAIYPQMKMSPYVAFDTKEVYYGVGDNRLIDLDAMIPGRNVLHIPMHTKEHPLIGVTPLVAAKLSANTGTSIQGHENRFFANMSRPSGVLSTDMTLTADQTKSLRDRFNELSKDMNTGGLPILTSGLQYQQVSMSAVDAEIIETYKMTKEDIASVFRIPLPLIGVMDKATFNNTETLMKFWVSSGLGYIIEHIENSLEDLFDLPANEHIEFDTEFLLQADFKGRMDGLKTAVQGGIMTPNEARTKEGLSRVEDGDKPFMQMQMVSLGYGDKKLDADIENAKKANEAPPAPTEPLKDPKDDVTEEDKAWAADMLYKIKGVGNGTD